MRKDEDLPNQSPKTYADTVFSFPHMPVDHHARGFSVQRKRIANKTSNPRLLKIHFHTYRYWKGTMLVRILRKRP